MFIIFNLEGCPYCKEAISLLEKHNLVYKTFNVNAENKEKIISTLLTHYIILAKYLDNQEFKKYEYYLTLNKEELCQQMRENIRRIIGRFTFPQIFVTNEAIVDDILLEKLSITKDIKHIGGCSDLKKDLS